jgi:signal transduction histidine kinase
MSKFDIPWQALIDTSPDGVFVLDADETVQYANAATLTLLDLPVPAGTPVFEWLDNLGDLSRHLLLKTIRERDQVRIHLPDAQHPFLRIQAESLEGEGAVLCRVSRDHIGEAAETIAHIVHELRLPMTSIMGYAKMMMTIGAESLNDMQRQFLETIDRNVKRLDSNLLAVHDMTRVDRGVVKLSLAPRSPNVAAEQVLKEFRTLVEEKGHQVTLDLPEELPKVRADGDRFKQVFRILLENALKYAPAGSQINLRGHVADGMLQVDVSDNGLGMPAVDQEQVFEKFFRGEGEQIREHSGLGLNLYIARGMVELQGGRLWFESTQGQGSTFSFTLPVWEE